MRCRVAVGLLVAAAFVAFAAPTTFLARRAGARGGFAPMALHRWLLSMLRVRVRRFGVPAPGPRLLVVNHVSWLDILILGAAEPMAFLAKSEVGAVVWTRWLVDLQGAVYVDRQRKRCIPAVNAEIARRIAAGGCVALFAEGTTSDGTRLLPFRSSHFEPARTGVVQPVYLHYRATGGLAATRGDKLVAAWYGDMDVPCLVEAGAGVRRRLLRPPLRRAFRRRRSRPESARARGRSRDAAPESRGARWIALQRFA